MTTRKELTEKEKESQRNLCITTYNELKNGTIEGEGIRILGMKKPVLIKFGAISCWV